MKDRPEDLKNEILRLTRLYSEAVHSQNQLGANQPESQFKPGKSVVPYAGRVFDADEVSAAVSSSLDFWLTLGKEGDAFETQFAKFLGIKRSILVNSGSSANLLAISALSSPLLKERKLKQGDEIITVAAGFPTTVAPIIQNGFVPVFIDNDPLTLNAKVDQLEEAYIEGKTKAVVFAHTLGNPFDLTAVKSFCEKHQLWLVEDNCDALGSRYQGQFTGTFGDLSTQSFYPPHHLTLGEGGCVNIVNEMRFKMIVESFRDWGRDCWCASGKDNTCGKRFEWQLGEMPQGYDHKFIYSHLGYNLKPLDIQAAIGLQQLKKLPAFIEARKKNWSRLRAGMKNLKEFFEFNLPTRAREWTPQGFSWNTIDGMAACEPSWFGFMLMTRPTAPFSRSDLARYLDSKKIGNRMLFGGNLTRQPAFLQLKKDAPAAYRVIGELKGADQIMNNALFIGVYPGLTDVMLDYMIESITSFCQKY